MFIPPVPSCRQCYPGSRASWGCEVVTVNELTTCGFLAVRNVPEICFHTGVETKACKKRPFFAHAHSSSGLPISSVCSLDPGNKCRGHPMVGNGQLVAAAGTAKNPSGENNVNDFRPNDNNKKVDSPLWMR